MPLYTSTQREILSLLLFNCYSCSDFKYKHMIDFLDMMHYYGLKAPYFNTLNTFTFDTLNSAGMYFTRVELQM